MLRYMKYLIFVLLIMIMTAGAPRNLQITPRQLIYQPGDTIQCSAEGNPAPSYQWTDLVSGRVIQGAVLIISEDMLDNTHTFQCTASNLYNSTSSIFSFSVEGNDILISRLGI